ncbi:protocadherin-9-like [Brachionus plicatilis]|uniref:Protocadherin-9-like n=1 Tax=Brachionus plicatilis TaxID=10195 RepID=A0A3M7QXT6_BRAPC|nr:protocadherin-9-like [Brachionus plicatilis]
MSILLIVCMMLPQANSMATYVTLTDKTIAEEIPIGSLIADLSQESAATTTDSHFTFLHDIKTSVENTYFLLDAVTGRLTSKRYLDRESMCLNKHCANKCQPDGTCRIPVQILLIPNYTIFQFTVHIEDINDNMPTFASDYQLKRIAWDASVGHRIAVQHAYDPDFGLNSIQTYHLLDKHTPFELVLDQSLYLSVSRPLHRQSAAGYNLTIEACDAGKPVHCSATLVHVVLIDANENKPRFERSSYHFQVAENRLQSAVIGRVKALGLDSFKKETNFTLTKTSEVINSITYSLINNPGSYFCLNAHTGELSVNKWFDYEKEKYFSLNIEARQPALSALHAYTNVEVSVLDLNDNEPHIALSFLNELYRNQTHDHVIIYMLENLQSNKFIAHAQIKDKDEVSSDKLEWNVFVDDTELKLAAVGQRQDNYFTINKLNSHSFSLSTGSRQLDREIMPEVKVSVRATDQTHTVFFNFSIIVLDENDNAPSLDKLTYDLNINENNYVDQLIHKFEARDPDLGQNAMLTYSLEPVVHFVYIEPLTGYLRASKVFDRELQPVYEFYIVVRDNPTNSSLSKSTMAKCRLNIIDLNDNPPLVMHNSSAVTNLSVRVDENVDADSRIAELACVDKDSSSKVTFHLNSDNLPFKISPDGFLVTTGQLDRESRDVYQFEAMCSDGKFNTSLNITVYLNDLNDNCPRGLHHTDRLVRVLNVSSGLVIFTQFYTDDDTGPNARLQFDLDNQRDKFSLSTRQIKDKVYEMNLSVADASLLSEAPKRHHVRVRVNDGGDKRCQIVEHFEVFVGDEQAFNESLTERAVNFMPLMRSSATVFYVLLVGFFVTMGCFFVALSAVFMCTKHGGQTKRQQVDGLKVRNYRLMEAVKLEASNRLSLSTDESGGSVSSEATKETASASPLSAKSAQQISVFQLSSFQKTNVVRVSDYSSDASDECNELSGVAAYSDGVAVCAEERVPCLVDIYRANSYGHYMRSSISFYLCSKLYFVYLISNAPVGFNPDNPKLREVPLFPIKLWCLQQRVLKDMPGSNNSLEAWHKSFSQDIASHPCVNKLIKNFIIEKHAVECSLEQIKSGVIFQKDKREMDRDDKISCSVVFSSYKKESNNLNLSQKENKFLAYSGVTISYKPKCPKKKPKF